MELNDDCYFNGDICYYDPIDCHEHADPETCNTSDNCYWENGYNFCMEHEPMLEYYSDNRALFLHSMEKINRLNPKFVGCSVQNTSHILTEIFLEDFRNIYPGYNHILGGPEVGEAFTKLHFDHLLYTGSGNIGKHVSKTERRASTAERESNDRYTAQHMKNHLGEAFVARVSGVTRAGLFITLEATGADGLVPIRSLPDDYYEHDGILHTLTGRNTGLKYYLGQNLDVLLIETVPITGGMIFNILDSGVGYPSKASKKRKRVARNSRTRVK